MIRLVPFEEDDFSSFISWIGSAEELQQFAGPIFSFPLTEDQLRKYINDPIRFPYKIKLSSENIVIGHCELNYERATPRLSRILIADPNSRGKGYGKATVNKLLQILFLERNFEDADLNVYDWNTSAITCYKAIGFTKSDTPITQTLINKKIWNGINMRIKKEDWIALNSER